MKKFYITLTGLLSLFLFSWKSNAQYTYLAEWAIQQQAVSYVNQGYQFIVYAVEDTTQESGAFLFSGSGDTNTPQSFVGKRVITSSVPLTQVALRFQALPINGPASFTYSNMGCNVPFVLYGSTANVSYFRVYEVDSFTNANSYDATNSTLSECETESLTVYTPGCSEAVAYGVEYQVGGSTIWNTLLPYAERPETFSFEQSDFSGLNTGENLRLRILYNPGATPEYSEVLTYVYLPCPPVLNGTTPSNISCFDSSDGSAKLFYDRPLANGEQFRATLSGLTPEGFTIPEANVIVDNFAVDNSYTWQNLVPGNYSITYQTFILNGPGSADDQPTSTGETGTFTINRPSEVTVAISSTDQPNCPGDTGSVTLSAIGGQDLESGTYQYSNNGGAWQNSPVFNNLPQGSSNVFRSRLVLGGGVSCISPSNATVNINQITNGVTITSGAVNREPGFPGAADGEIRINITGGAPDFNYQVTGPVTRNLSTTASSGVLTGLPSGTYSLSVTDANGCTATFSGTVTLTNVPLPTITSMQVTQPISCFGASDAEVTVTISGGNAPYNYQWLRDGVLLETNSTNGTFIRGGLSEGSYTINVSSSVAPVTNPSARTSQSVTVTEPAQLVIANASANDISCFGGNDGSISVMVNGGTAPYRYRISNTGNFTSATGSTFDIPVGMTGDYPLFIRDANDCQVVFGSVLTISEPTDPIQVTEVLASHVDNTQNGGFAGVLEISVINNVGIATTEWTRNGTAFVPPAGSTQTRLIDLPAGNYNLILTDTNGCTGSLANPIEILEPGPLAITDLSGTDISCFGEATGSIQVTVTGTPPFNFVWEKQGEPGFTAPNTNTISGLTAGTYTLRLTDASTAPEVTSSVTLMEPTALLDATATPTEVSCNGGGDGVIVVSANGGTPPYSYALDGGAFQTLNSFSSLLPRDYTITVRDANACEFDTTASVTEPDAISVVLDGLTNVSVNGGTDGAIAISIQGGTAPYDISWSGPGAFSQVTEDISGLAAGTYTLQIRDARHTTDASGCFYLENFTVIEPGPLSILAVDVVDVTCKGEATGAITLTATGTDPINFEWEFNGTIIPGETTNSLQNVVAGIYTVTIDDATATPPITQNITVGEPLEALTATGIATQVSCFGGADGSIQVNAQGGVPPYSYALDNGAVQSSNTFNDLGEGFYGITVWDANNCEYQFTNDIFVNEPAELILIVDQQTNLTAEGSDDGAISVTVAGGTSPYTYEWFSDNGFSATNEDVTDLPAGNYTLIVRDANHTNDSDGCTLIEDFVITEPGQLIVSAQTTVFLECFGDDFGEIVVDVQGGVQPYAYEWFQISGGSNTPLNEFDDILGDLEAGEYFVRVTDANGVTIDSNSVLLEEPPLLTVQVVNTTDVLCTGEATGSIAIAVQGGTPPYRYFWSNGETTQNLQNIAAGEYTIEVADSNGCFVEINTTVQEPSNALRFENVTITNVSEYEGADGAIDVDILGGIGPYTIEWVRLADNSSLGGQTNLSNLIAGDYQLNVTDDNGCTLANTFTVTQPDVIEATVIQPTCFGSSDGSIALEVNFGNGNFSYSWSNGATTSTISNLGAGDYTVTVTGFDNGPEMRTYTLVDPVPLEVDLGEDRVLCDGQVLTLDATVEGTDITYEWSSNTGFSSNAPIVDLNQSGTYSLTISNQNGCTATGTITIEVIEDEISAEFAMSSQAFVDEPVIAVDISFPIPDTLQWILPDGATVLKQDNDELEVVFAEAGEYEIGILTTRGQCLATQTKKVLIVERDGTVTGTTTDKNTKNLEDFLIYPNPTNGRFTADIELSERANISVKIFSFANNTLITSAKERGESSYRIAFDISAMPSGVYAVLLETPFGNRLQKVIIR
ncbi:hypothetical protein MTsPCn5_00240 [Croceitalea sp. MTPC5]|uniref:T9SS type A sorting domain-containing protein n=1 Tax=Croceitalea sp. MTPC5 TaxID=3056565 RepID=UPI002B377DCB|nr:hypothetical protein MTsPCn5_00240 [Croceitalea sp. MTPC5]